jgi:hypothetical protein
MLDTGMLSSSIPSAHTDRDPWPLCAPTTGGRRQGHQRQALALITSEPLLIGRDLVVSH